MSADENWVLLIKAIFVHIAKGEVRNPSTDHSINISKYNPLLGSSCIKLPNELDYPRKGLINIPSIDDNECFKWCLVRYLHPAVRSTGRITKADKDFAEKLDIKDTKFPIRVRDIQNIFLKKRIPSALVWGMLMEKACSGSKYACIMLIHENFASCMLTKKTRSGSKYDYTRKFIVQNVLLLWQTII